MKKTVIFRAILILWIVLWVFFLVREDKDGQYDSLKYLYGHNYADKVKFIMGKDLYGFSVFCSENIPRGSTYELSGFKKFSIDEVRMRYFLWPLVGTSGGADYKIVFGSGKLEYPGYKEYQRFENIGTIYIKA
ncbi:MAG: hypothetical protein KAI70_01810 [Candidatus Omnitrophica bacterium]|nr:hypothetical protein [Candidatus Omnitrophota bacterium]